MLQLCVHIGAKDVLGNSEQNNGHFTCIVPECCQLSGNKKYTPLVEPNGLKRSANTQTKLGYWLLIFFFLARVSERRDSCDVGVDLISLSVLCPSLLSCFFSFVLNDNHALKMFTSNKRQLK